MVEQRRLAQINAAKQETDGARQQVHGLLHTAEQALAAGQLHAARAAADEIRSRKAGAGVLPKPTVQRLSRLVQQLTELERWESFGQQQARVQLCERAEAAATQSLDAPRLAAEVQKLRNEWKALDEQHAGVPKALWERFDQACEKAYAPAARHFAEQAAQRKEARKAREEFIATAAAHAPTLLAEPRDWRAIERWLRETDQQVARRRSRQRRAEGVEEFRRAVPGRASPRARRAGHGARRGEGPACGADRGGDGARRESDGPRRAVAGQGDPGALAGAGQGIGARAARRARLWEQFRAACDAVFKARDATRKQEDDQKHEGRRALEEICAQLEQLAQATDKDDADAAPRAARARPSNGSRSRARSVMCRAALDSRFTNAKAAVEGAMGARAHAREAAVWQTLAAKERLCEELDGLLAAHSGTPDAATTATEQWSALPALPPAWEKAMLARRDAALHALADEAVAEEYLERLAEAAEARREALLELEMALGLDIPPELQALRLALQVKKLRDRFQDATKTAANTPAERLLAWCAQPGVATAQDRQRIERVMASMEKAR